MPAGRPLQVSCLISDLLGDILIHGQILLRDDVVGASFAFTGLRVLPIDSFLIARKATVLGSVGVLGEASRNL